MTMPGRQLIMDFEVTPTSHTLEAYRARGGYATLEKALKTMQPADVTRRSPPRACWDTAAPPSRSGASGR